TQTGQAAGTLVDGNQHPVTARIVLLPYPLPMNPSPAAIRTCDTDAKGAFRFTGLIPGKYVTVALAGEEENIRDHDFALLAGKIHAADAFEVTAGQTTTVSGMKP